MPTGEVPRYPEVMSKSAEITGNALFIEESLTFERNRLGHNLPDDVLLARFFMRTGADYLGGKTSQALHDNTPNGFYPGGIRYESPQQGFKQSDENTQKTIMLNYAAVVYGLAVDMVDEMMQRDIGIFPIAEFCARYNALVTGTAFPKLELHDFQNSDTQNLIRISTTDEGPGEIMAPHAMENLRTAYQSGGVSFLFDENTHHNMLPQSLLWFIRKQNLAESMRTIHGEVRKHLRTLNNGRRVRRQQMGEQLIQGVRLAWLADQLGDLDLDPGSPPTQYPQTHEE